MVKLMFGGHGIFEPSLESVVLILYAQTSRDNHVAR